MLDALDRIRILNEVLDRLGTARALEASETHNTPAPSPFGVVGVDMHHGKYRARIRFCHALTGKDTRITLLRSDSLDEAEWAYRLAHVHLWGAASWAANDNIMGAIADASRN